MKVTEHLARAQKTLFSIEVLPPKKGDGLASLLKTIEELMPYRPAFIDVTTHATQVTTREIAGVSRSVPVRKRPGTLSTCAVIQHRFGVDTVPHLICSGHSVDETEDALIELSFLGISNVMALRGDPVFGADEFIPVEGGHAFAKDLVEQIAKMNDGEYCHEAVEFPDPTDFCIGVAGYPEGLYEGADLDQEMDHLKQKIDAGAGFITTQMFFDNGAYFRFVERCRKAGINAPIIPGLKPLTTPKQIKVMGSMFNANVPAELQAALHGCSPGKSGREWCIRQSQELREQGAPCLHYYTMSRPGAVKDVAEAIFGR